MPGRTPQRATLPFPWDSAPALLPEQQARRVRALGVDAPPQEAATRERAGAEAAVNLDGLQQRMGHRLGVRSAGSMPEFGSVLDGDIPVNIRTEPDHGDVFVDLGIGKLMHGVQLEALDEIVDVLTGTLQGSGTDTRWYNGEHLALEIGFNRESANEDVICGAIERGAAFVRELRQGLFAGWLEPPAV